MPSKDDLVHFVFAFSAFAVGAGFLAMVVLEWYKEVG